MKIREQELIYAKIGTKKGEYCIQTLISYDTAVKLLNNELLFINKNFPVFNNSIAKGDNYFYVKDNLDFVSFYFNLFERIEVLVDLEEQEKEAELILAKKELIDILNSEYKDLSNMANSRYANIDTDLFHEIINNLKR